MKRIQWRKKNGEIIILFYLLSDRDIFNLIFYSHYNDAIMNEMLANRYFFGTQSKNQKLAKTIEGMTPFELKNLKCLMNRDGAYKLYCDNLERFRNLDNLAKIAEKAHEKALHYLSLP